MAVATWSSFRLARMQFRTSTALLTLCSVAFLAAIPLRALPQDVALSMMNAAGKASAGATWAIPGAVNLMLLASAVLSLTFLLSSALKQNVQIQFAFELIISTLFLWLAALIRIA